MSVRVTWQPSADANIASYDIERALSIGGPWTFLVNVIHAIPGADWDANSTAFFYVDATGSASTYYRLIAIDSDGLRSPASTPFNDASVALTTGIPSLVNSVSIPVGEVSALLGLGFTTIEVWASEDGNAWEEITAAAAAPATRVTDPAVNTFAIGGLYLDFQINGGTIHHVEFQEAIQDWTPQQVVTAINAVLPGTASTDGSVVGLSSQTTGRSSSLTIVNYPTVFGLSQSTTYGKDGRITLVDGANVYTFYDLSGTDNTRYKWRFSADGVNPISKFSQYKTGKPAPISNTPLSLATARFIGVDGRPVKTTVLISPETDSKTFAGFTQSSGVVLSIESDDTGFWSYHLLQGARVRAAIEGTNLIRTFIVPSTASFDLLQAMSEVADPFTVQSPQPLLTRRNV
jgi:hypothetical protein